MNKTICLSLRMAVAVMVCGLSTDTLAGWIPACTEAMADLDADTLLISGNFKRCSRPSVWLGQADGSYAKLNASVIDTNSVEADLTGAVIAIGSTQNVVVKCGKYPLWHAFRPLSPDLPYPGEVGLNGYPRCEIDVAFSEDCEECEERPVAPVPKTGQTDSSAPGDDGELEKGVDWPVPRFNINVNPADDNGNVGGIVGNGICDGEEVCNGTVTDNLTGLIWLKNANCYFGGQGWGSALAVANKLNTGECGLSDGSVEGDWRLPNIKELQSLVDFGRFNPALPFGHPFANVQSSYYWSSTSTASNPNYAWGLNLYYSGVYNTGKAGARDVWPVRGGQ